MPRNQMKAKWERGEAAFGSWCTTGAPLVAELFGLDGFDYVCLDAQHGLFGYESLLASLYGMTRTGTTPIVRVPANDLAWIGKVLDAGAHGVIIPMVETGEDAALAVAHCRIFPLGHRSYGPIRAAQTLGGDPTDLNREIACIVMIETARGVENAEAICSTPGVDAVYVGPADLAVTYGLAPTLSPQPGPHADAIATVRKTCQAHGIAAGIQCVNGDDARAMADAGFTMVTVCADAQLLRAAAQAELAKARRVGGSEAGGVHS